MTMTPEEIKALLKRAGLTEAEACRVTGWSRRTYYRRRKDGRWPPLMLRGLKAMARERTKNKRSEA